MPETTRHHEYDGSQGQFMVLAERGFSPLGLMTCTYEYDLTRPIAAVPLPPGYAIRSVAEHGDIDGLIRLERVVFENDGLDLEWYRGKSSAPSYSPDLHLHVVAPTGELAAFAHGWADLPSGLGEIDPVGTHPDHRRKRLAAAAVTACLSGMRAKGLRRAYVAAEAEPDPANRLYESLGPAVKWYEDRWGKKLAKD